MGRLAEHGVVSAEALPVTSLLDAVRWLRHYFNSEELNTSEGSCSVIKMEVLR